MRSLLGSDQADTSLVGIAAVSVLLYEYVDGDSATSSMPATPRVAMS
ncbi:hypothetical protein QLQ12_34845 [Actinoplanes sp. NEAU-A12]|uniref:Uncharacterized protein n=1 Tax=Actinoplanes sandaracinus TaxID=3045177 RepID=A0ABT6WW04_9ACTN|nr:hypothetical protein [Actinoplanes sandaracinus]MDI6103805.1 hypothetical protein [Actinoplanes sandaracinus]